MTRQFVVLALVGSVVLGSNGTVVAQDKPVATKVTPVQTQVVISRYQGDKKIRSLPYALSAPVNQGVGRLQVGGNVPVPSGDGKGTQYRNVGTSIDVSVRVLDDGRYEVSVNVSESAVADEGQRPLSITPGVAPVLKTYTSSSTLVLRDGQTAQFTAATDPITGETVRVDVTLSVPK